MSTSTILNSGGQVVLCFGSNFFGQLGIGRLVRQSSSSPCAFGSPSVEVIDAIRSGDIADIQCGAEFTVVLYKDGRLMICGTLNGNVSPTLSNIAVSYPLKCSQVRCGRKHILALMEGGFVLSWGIGYFGQLGHGDDTSWESPKLISFLEPRRIGSVVVDIFCGGYHSGALTSSGQVFMWGLNKSGQCGVSSKADSIMEPAVIDRSQLPGERIKKLILGRNHSFLQTQSGKIFAWGATSFGRLGNPAISKKMVPIPTEVPFFNQLDIVSIETGDFHLLALDSNHNVYFCGYGGEGQNGMGNLLHCRLPKKIDFFDNIKVLSIHCGATWCMAITETGDLYSWGYGDGGWLGLDIPASRRLPLLESDSESPLAILVPQSRSFDSMYNVLIPKYVRSLSNYHVDTVRAGGCFSIVFCSERKFISLASSESSKNIPGDDSDEGSVHSHPSQPKSFHGVDSKSSYKMERSDSKSSVLSLKEIEELLPLWCKHNSITEIESALQRGVDVNSCDQNGNSLLILSCQYSHDNLSKFLINRGADLNASNKQGNTALHFCFSNGSEELGRYLISLGADEFAANSEGLTCYEGLTISDLEAL